MACDDDVLLLSLTEDPRQVVLGFGKGYLLHDFSVLRTITADGSGTKCYPCPLTKVLPRSLTVQGSGASCYALACSVETGRSNAGLKNRLAMAAKMIGAKPITAAKTSRPALPITPFLYNP